MKISACWIAKDEAAGIERSMASVRDAVDELIVVDTGSADSTAELARAFGARVEHFPWTKDFSAARNRAMELAEGEIVVFLDADEWFDPAWGAKDREMLERIFTSNIQLDALQVSIRNLGETGGTMGTGSVDRILRKRPGLRFLGRVHERYLKENGADIRKQYADFWTLLHTGYMQSLRAGKAARNIDLLEAAVTAEDSEERRFLNRCYLVREYGNRREDGKAAPHLRQTLDQPALIQRLAREMGEGFLSLLYPLLETAARCRETVSRLELERKVVRVIEKNFGRHPASDTIRIYHGLLFGMGEDSLLAGIDAALTASGKRTPGVFSGHLSAEARLLGAAAEAALRRGDRSRAERYARACLNLRQDPQALRVLQICAEGGSLPPTPGADPDAIRRTLEAGQVPDRETLRDLLVTAEREGGEARLLYDRAAELLDALTDLRDLIRTGYAADDCDKKELRALKAMTLSQLDKAIQTEDLPRAVTEELLSLSERAGEAYESRRMYGMALRHYRLAAARGYHAKENYSCLGRVFRALGNAALAGELERRA